MLFGYLVSQFIILPEVSYQLSLELIRGAVLIRKTGGRRNKISIYIPVTDSFAQSASLGDARFPATRTISCDRVPS